MRHGAAGKPPNCWWQGSCYVRFGSQADVQRLHLIRPLCPRKQTLLPARGMSACSQKRNLAAGQKQLQFRALRPQELCSPIFCTVSTGSDRDRPRHDWQDTATRADDRTGASGIRPEGQFRIPRTPDGPFWLGIGTMMPASGRRLAFRMASTHTQAAGELHMGNPGLYFTSPRGQRGVLDRYAMRE